jgi:hypothetical protein
MTDTTTRTVRPRLSKGKIARWQKDIAKATELLERVDRETREQAANPLAKHHAPLADVRAPLGRSAEWLTLTGRMVEKLRP